MMGSLTRFALVGLANTVVGYTIILFMHFTVGASLVVANVAGYAGGMILSYLLNRSFTFASTRAHREAIPRFALTVIVCFMLNLVVLEIGVASLGLSVPLAQALAVVTYTVAFYVATRSLIFKS